MKALPFPCIRPAQDRVLEALPQMGGILSGNDALRGAIADGLMLKDPGAAYYVYECSGEPGRVTGVVAICPVDILAGDGVTPADATAAARAIAELKVQPRPVALTYEASPVMDIILGAAKEGASLYAVTDPSGITHRVWEVKREDAVAAIRAMLDQAPEPTPADDPAYAAALAGAAQLLANEACTAGTYTGKEPFNFTVATLFPAAQVAAGAPQVPTGLLTHQIARFERGLNAQHKDSAAQQTRGGDTCACIPAPFASSNYVGNSHRRALPAPRARCRHQRLKTQLVRIIFLRKDFDQFKRIGCIVKCKMQHRTVARHALSLVGRRPSGVVQKLLDGRSVAHRKDALVVRASHKIGQRRHHALAHPHLTLTAKLTIKVTPRTLGHQHHALGLKVAKEPLAQAIQTLVGKARPQVGDSLLGAMQRRGVGVIGFNATRAQEHTGTRRLLAAQLRERRIAPPLNDAFKVEYRLPMTDQIQVFNHRGPFIRYQSRSENTPSQ